MIISTTSVRKIQITNCKLTTYINYMTQIDIFFKLYSLLSRQIYSNISEMTIKSVIPSGQHKGVAPHQPPLTVLQVILYKIAWKLQNISNIWRIKNIKFLQLYTAIYKKLNDRHNHKTAYPQRIQYLDG